MSCLHALSVFWRDSRLSNSFSGFPSRDIYYDFCGACAATFVIFGHLSCSLYLLTYLHNVFFATDDVKCCHSSFLVANCHQTPSESNYLCVCLLYINLTECLSVEINRSIDLVTADVSALLILSRLVHLLSFVVHSLLLYFWYVTIFVLTLSL